MKKFISKSKNLISILIAFSILASALFAHTTSFAQTLNVKSKSLPTSTNQRQIVITFSENISKGENYNKITLTKNKKSKVAFTASIAANKLIISIKDPLTPKAQYQLIIPAKAVKGTKGASNRELKFTFIPQSQSTNLSGRILIAGSTSVQPLADELAKYFMQQNPKVSIEVQGGGSSVGIKSAIQGIVDIGTSSRELTEDERKQLAAKGWQEIKIAEDGIAVIVHKTNPVSNLSVEQIRDIFSGKIKNWKEVGGKNAPIVVVTREEGSGTRGAFEEIVMGKAKITDSAIVQPSTGAVKTTVSQDENAIGFISLGVLDSTVKGVKVDGVEPTEKNVKLGKYKVKRPFLFLVSKNPSRVTKAFVDFVLSDEGQAIVAKNYISVK
ncbi:phosphate ABC transporter substrate-binding protein PstS family protein [Caldicellulosiruptor naganoensis]|uniref:Phosphate-binding protein n=1 Tax=Caldicellulosiruptor naganoensis TaxID=29324 RepID=A0ABY7BFH6_9FIRM|nr:phosphate ABC transporter substrate-binding protein PstS family protein [Caldicellulosiruptor naganoensis]WAM31563.1 phosphate ABC transporter substrate-binding protein PstS family protein [Caldicellulosiruptor naganoensis]